MGSRCVGVCGMKQLAKQLEKLPDKLKKNIMRGAMRAASKELVDQTKAMVPVKTGTLRDSIVRADKKGTKTSVVSGLAFRGAGRFYWHLVEFGRLGDNKDRDGRTIAPAPARPYLRPALETHAQRLVELTRDYVAKRLAKVASGQTTSRGRPKSLPGGSR